MKNETIMSGKMRFRFDHPVERARRISTIRAGMNSRSTTATTTGGRTAADHMTMRPAIQSPARAPSNGPCTGWVLVQLGTAVSMNPAIIPIT